MAVDEPDSSDAPAETSGSWWLVPLKAETSELLMEADESVAVEPNKDADDEDPK